LLQASNVEVNRGNQFDRTHSVLLFASFTLYTMDAANQKRVAVFARRSGVYSDGEE